jgi:hypothetical protein
MYKRKSKVNIVFTHFLLSITLSQQYLVSVVVVSGNRAVVETDQVSVITHRGSSASTESEASIWWASL